MRIDANALTIGAALRQATDKLRSAGLDTPALDARIIAAHVLGLAHDRLLLVADHPMAGRALAELDDAVSRRLGGEPVSRILGQREFWGHTFAITPATLDPRPETETLIEAALAIIAREQIARPRLLDVGTGTGCILLTLLSELPYATGTATDVSEGTLEVARRNAARLGVADRAQFRCVDLFQGIIESFDMLIANPPYIRSGDISALAPEVARHDPRQALDGGPDGLAFYRRIVSQVSCVVPDGWVVLEVGSDQAEQVLELAKVAGAIAEGTATTYIDFGGHKRCVAWKTHA